MLSAIRERTGMLYPHSRSLRFSDTDLERMEDLGKELDSTGTEGLRNALRWAAKLEHLPRLGDDEVFNHSRLIKFSDRQIEALTELTRKHGISEADAARYALRAYAEHLIG